MKKVNLEEIDYPYINIEVKDSDAEQIGINLKKLYLYIDEHKNMGRVFKFGNAYKAIKLRANQLLGRRDIKISKREVTSLIKYFTSIKFDKYIKIPFKMYYIFEAIFELVDEIKLQYPLPADVNVFVGRVRRDCFYEIQSKLYKDIYNKPDVYCNLTKALHDEMYAPKSILSERF